MFATFWVVVLLHCCASLTEAQQSGCSNLPTSTQVATLIGQNLAGGGQSPNPPIITLQTSPFGYRVVCSSSSGFRNQYRFVSIVANYTSSDQIEPGPLYGQFEFECVSSAWSVTSDLLGTTSTDRTTLSASSAAITANITTNCAYCLKQSVSSNIRVSDDTNHCSACTGCSQPLCYTPDTVIPTSGTIRQTCCNFYSPGGACTTTCDPPSFPDANRTCTLCTLNCQNNGTLRSDMCGCNCTAVSTGPVCSTCLCQNGGNCTGNTCTCPPGYSGQLCNTCIHICPTGNYLNSSTCSCVPSVRGTPVQQLQTGSSCGPGCIGAIIGAILGVLLVAGIVAAVIVGVYYVTHGAGASTKGYTVPGTNGMTKDNPLYLDPKVVEESVTQ
eukprot:Em0005g1407a